MFGFEGEGSIEEGDGVESGVGAVEFAGFELGNPVSEGVA